MINSQALEWIPKKAHPRPMIIFKRSLRYNFSEKVMKSFKSKIKPSSREMTEITVWR